MLSEREALFTFLGICVQFTLQIPTCIVTFDLCSEEKSRNQPDSLQSGPDSFQPTGWLNASPSGSAAVTAALIIDQEDVGESGFLGDRWKPSMIILYDISSSTPPGMINGRLSALCNHSVKSMPRTSALLSLCMSASYSKPKCITLDYRERRF